MKLGIFSTFPDPAALDLVQTVRRAVKTGVIPNTEIAFVFSNRELGESPTTDSMLRQLSKEETPLITLSARKFTPEKRQQAKIKEEHGDPSSMLDWRNQFGTQVLDLLPPTDIDLLLGDMYVWGDNMCRERRGINLHPALPDGPIGEWYKVIWDIIETNASKTGVMMHRVTPDLDRGPAVTYCSFPIQGYPFKDLWDKLPTDPQELAQVILKGRREREKTQHPLHREIREYGLAREFPLIIQTVKALAEGTIAISGESEGLDLTQGIDRIVRPILEGRIVRKETRI